MNSSRGQDVFTRAFRGRSLMALLGAALLLLLISLSLKGVEPAGAGAESSGQADRSLRAKFGKMVEPCSIRRMRKKLLCPDLSMRKPFDLWFSRTPGGRLILHAANDIQSRGAGPLEIRGHKHKPNTKPNRMKTRQIIHKRGPGKYRREASGHLVFYPIPYQGRYWKYAHAARFEMWKLNGDREKVKRVRVGPKADYCFRDLQRTKPSGRSPGYPVYPGCSQDMGISGVTLGTSVGWSDVYPSNYDDNLINVTGLKGCYLFRQLADPKNQLSELNEKNNIGKRRLRLTGKPTRIRSC